MASPSHELLAAERALGRLVQQRDDAQDLAEVLEVDALRREVWASLQLDAALVHLEDIAAAQITVGLLPAAKHDGAVKALALLRAAEAMMQGLAEGDSSTSSMEQFDGDDLSPDILDLIDEDSADDGYPPSATAMSDAIAAARASAADLEAFLAGGMVDRRHEDADTLAPRLLTPLSGAWMSKAWKMAFGRPNDAEAAAIEMAVTDIDAALSSNPGLSGVALALHRMHGDGYWPQEDLPRPPEGLRRAVPDLAEKLDLVWAERQELGPGWCFARLISPWIVGRACELGGPAPWLSESILLRRTGYSRASSMREGEWERWLCGALADGWTLQRRRLPETRHRLETWRAKISGGLAASKGRGKGRRPSRGGPMAVVPILAAQPVLTPEWLSRRLGVTARAAQVILSQMKESKVVIETSGERAYRIYEAVG